MATVMINTLLITAAGDVTDVQIPRDNVRPWAGLIGATWCDIVHIRAAGHPFMLLAVDDEGRLTHKPINRVATLLVQAYGRAHSYPLVGDVLVMGWVYEDAVDVTDRIRHEVDRAAEVVAEISRQLAVTS